jgi:KEOPS complex subunit Pcc1
MKGYLDLVFETEDPERIYEALIPESDDQLPRSRISLEVIQDAIRLRIEGDDIVSIRAALNTWVRLIKIAWEMVNV